LNVRTSAHSKLHSLDLVLGRIHARNVVAAAGVKGDQSTSWSRK